VQDGYDLYAHSFFFSDDGNWCVVQQGMSDATLDTPRPPQADRFASPLTRDATYVALGRFASVACQGSRIEGGVSRATGYARRYHWFSRGDLDFVCEPHQGIESQGRPGEQLCLLNMVAAEADASRTASVQVARLDPDRVLREVQAGPSLFLPRHHAVKTADIEPKRLSRILRVLCEHAPADFERLLGVPGVGGKTVRSLALIAELIYDAPACRRDPATFSYAHGGKDGHPFPVDRPTYDRNIAILESALRRSEIAPNEKDRSLRALAALVGRQGR